MKFFPIFCQKGVFCLKESVCAVCHTYFTDMPVVCPSCAHRLIYTGDEQNVITAFEPNLLIHRYHGSDLLETAVLLKEGRTNCKVATKLQEYSRPLTVKKSEIYVLDLTLFASIESLREERYRTMRTYDAKFATVWHTLIPYYDDASYDPYGKAPNI